MQQFARDRAPFERDADRALAAVSAGGVLWVCWPKKSATALRSDLDRDQLVHALQARGWTSVASVSIDETWSALRFKAA